MTCAQTRTENSHPLLSPSKDDNLNSIIFSRHRSTKDDHSRTTSFLLLEAATQQAKQSTIESHTSFFAPQKQEQPKRANKMMEEDEEETAEALTPLERWIDSEFSSFQHPRHQQHAHPTTHHLPSPGGGHILGLSSTNRDMKMTATTCSPSPEALTGPMCTAIAVAQQQTTHAKFFSSSALSGEVRDVNEINNDEHEKEQDQEEQQATITVDDIKRGEEDERDAHNLARANAAASAAEAALAHVGCNDNTTITQTQAEAAATATATTILSRVLQQRQMPVSSNTTTSPSSEEERWISAVARLSESMRQSRVSQNVLQTWDSLCMGLKRSHSKTINLTSKTRNELLDAMNAQDDEVASDEVGGGNSLRKVDERKRRRRKGAVAKETRDNKRRVEVASMSSASSSLKKMKRVESNGASVSDDPPKPVFSASSTAA